MLEKENQTFKERIELKIYTYNTSNQNAMGAINIATWSKTSDGAWAALYSQHLYTYLHANVRN